MQLYTNPASPFCRKIEVILHEVGKSDDIEKTISIGHPTDTGSMPVNVNPVGKIPTLVRDEGPALYDSRVIARYLDQVFGGNLYPESRLWDVLTLEATGDGLCEAAVLMMYEVRSRPEEGRYPPYVEAQWEKVIRTLDALESRGMGLLNGPLNIGQISVGCALGYIDFRHEGRDWRSGRPAITDWFANISERASMKATEPYAP